MPARFPRRPPRPGIVRPGVGICEVSGYIQALGECSITIPLSLSMAKVHWNASRRYPFLAF